MYFYSDLLQSFFWCWHHTAKSILNSFSEHQYLHQLDPDIRHAVLGNAGTMISFRLGAEDAGFIAREFEPVFNPVDLLNLPNHDIYLKLMIDGTPSLPFSATTLLSDQLPR